MPDDTDTPPLRCAEATLGIKLSCQVDVLGIDTVGVEANAALCDQPAGVSLEITEADAGIDFPIAKLELGTDEEIPIPGLTFGIPVVGSADANMAVKLTGDLSALEVDLGVDACMSILGAKTCGGDLFSGLPIYVLQGQFDFSDMCNHKLKALRRKTVNATA